MSGHLNPGGQQFRGDHGAADPRVTAALAAYLEGRGSEQAALSALAAARLLVPVTAVLAGGIAAPDGATSPQDRSPAPDGGTSSPRDRSPAPDGGTSSPRDRSPAPDGGTSSFQNRSAFSSGDKNSEMMLPTLIGRDGRPAMLAFTSTGTLARWRPDARPVPAEADRVWRAAVADGCAVVIDVAGPVPLAIEGARLAALAARQPVPPPHEDPDVRAEVEAAVAGEPAIAGFSLSAGRADGTDLAVRLRLVGRGLSVRDWEPAVNRAAAGIAARLAARLRRGIEVSVTGSGE